MEYLTVTFGILFNLIVSLILLQVKKLTEKQKKLLEAARASNWEEVKSIIIGGVNPNFYTNSDLTPSILHIAALKDDLDIVVWLVEEGKCKVDKETVLLIGFYRNFSISHYLFQQFPECR